MGSKKCKSIFLIIILALFVVLLFNSNTVFAAINEHYVGTDVVTDENLSEAFESSSLLGMLAKLIYAVGRFLEWILGTIFKMLTGSSDFPWADKIVFNAVPLLDVNFINPGEGSFVIQPAIQDVLKNLYSTILTLAASFFGIVVLITSIKLVITTIASAKAKYKQAIVDWLVGFVMLFCIHYAISFIFYLNEQLVIVASKMVKANLERYDVKAKAELSQLTTQLIESMGSSKYNGVYKGENNVPIKTILSENTNIVQAFINLDSSEGSEGLHEFLQKGMSIGGWDYNVSDENQKQGLATIIVWAASVNVSLSELEQIRKYEIYPTTTYISSRGKVLEEGQSITKTNFNKIFGDQASTIRNRLNNSGLFLRSAEFACNYKG